MKRYIPVASTLLLLAGVGVRGWQLTAPQLVREGRLDEALAAFRAEVAEFPKSVPANNGMGVVLDLLGRYTEARQYLTQAIKVAKTPLEHAVAQRAMAVSYGFSGDCKGAEKYESSAFDFYLNTSDFYNAGEVADELGRLCIDAGDLDRAAEWYQKGHDTGLSDPKITPERTDLWNFRLDHARARIAARRGKAQEAAKLVKDARAILDKGRNPEQEPYFPYLSGYVAFYAGDYKTALTEFENAEIADPFIQCLTGQTWEALGDREKALEFYRRAANSTAHSVPAAYARPFAQRKLASGLASSTK
jgi:tetratricopeptide (TPR) repeat protein